jgi:hypothetical protein
MDRVLDKTDVFELKSDMSDFKTALKAKGIILTLSIHSPAHPKTPIIFSPI